MDLEGIMLSEIIRPKDKYCMISFILKSKNTKQNKIQRYREKISSHQRGGRLKAG